MPFMGLLTLPLTQIGECQEVGGLRVMEKEENGKVGTGSHPVKIP